MVKELLLIKVKQNKQQPKTYKQNNLIQKLSQRRLLEQNLKKTKKTLQSKKPDYLIQNTFKTGKSESLSDKGVF